jgi:hypothetical protein
LALLDGLSIAAGENGISTLLQQCGGLSATPIYSPGTDGGASLSYSYDGVAKQTTVSLKGAVGVNVNVGKLVGDLAPDVTARKTINSLIADIVAPTNLLPGFTKFEASPQASLFYQFDQESKVSATASNGDIQYKNAYTAKIQGVGAAFEFSATPEASKKSGIPEGFQIYFQPIYLADNLRHSNSVNFDWRMVPIHPCVNLYCTTPDATGEGWWNAEGPFQALQKAGIGVGLMLDARVDGAVFTERGTPLNESLGSKNPFPQSVIPNYDYARLGGRVGVMADFNNPYVKFNTSVYYTDFTALQGAHADFGEFGSQIKVPITGLFSIGLTYLNGRSENIAQREENWKLSIDFGGGSGSP